MNVRNEPERAYEITGMRTDCPPVDNERGLERYLAEQDYMLGMSYGTAVAFTVYAASR